MERERGLSINEIFGSERERFIPEDDNPNSQLSRVVEAVKDKSKLSTSVMAGLRHNTMTE